MKNITPYLHAKLNVFLQILGYKIAKTFNEIPVESRTYSKPSKNENLSSNLLNKNKKICELLIKIIKDSREDLDYEMNERYYSTLEQILNDVVSLTDCSTEKTRYIFSLFLKRLSSDDSVSFTNKLKIEGSEWLIMSEDELHEQKKLNMLDNNNNSTVDNIIRTLEILKSPDEITKLAEYNENESIIFSGTPQELLFYFQALNMKKCLKIIDDVSQATDTSENQLMHSISNFFWRLPLDLQTSFNNSINFYSETLRWLLLQLNELNETISYVEDRQFKI